MKKIWKKSICAAALVLALGMSAQAEEQSTEPGLVEAKIVTEVLDWGETVTALRLEYSEEIACDAIDNSNEHPGKLTYSLINDRDIVNLYVNNSGEKDDIQLKGKYVFINLGINNQDHMTYRDQVVFNTGDQTRGALSNFFLYQQEPIETVSGNVIPPSGRIVIREEMRVGIDDFETFTYTNAENDTWLNYHLYIPEGYEAKGDMENLPLVVHYPSGDYAYKDDGRYLGALFSHPDALFWATDEAQAANPAFVVTVGGERDANWSSAGSDAEVSFEASMMQQNYVSVIKEIVEKYNVDTSRIYAISLAGGTEAMYSTIKANPDLFAGCISTAYDPYMVYKDAELAETEYGAIMDEMATWSFAGLTDGSGTGSLGEDDTRLKGERLRDFGYLMNEKGYNVEVGYGEEGELMWNGLLRGAEAEELAKEQIARADQIGSDDLITLYIPGTILQTMHWSWNATYSNLAVQDWLYDQVNDAPML